MIFQIGLKAVNIFHRQGYDGAVPIGAVEDDRAGQVPFSCQLEDLCRIVADKQRRPLHGNQGIVLVKTRQNGRGILLHDNGQFHVRADGGKVDILACHFAQTGCRLFQHGQSLLSFSAENCATVLQDAERQFAGNKRSVNKLISLRSSIDQYRKIAQIEADDLNRKEAIKSNRKEAVHYLKEIDSGKLHHYYFLPQAAYLDNEIKSKGLIVDLLEIESLTLKDAQKIANPLAEGILYQDLPPLPTIEELSQVNEFDALRERFKERLRLEKTFWLKDSSDFVQIEGTIKSPWCEHLMQRFSNVFIRIGLDNPSEDDYNTLIDGCCLEE